MLRRRPEVRDLDPKAVTNDELFGIINPATREWKDGLFRCILIIRTTMIFTESFHSVTRRDDTSTLIVLSDQSWDLYIHVL